MNDNGMLDNIPDGFDRNMIVDCRQCSKPMRGATVRLSKCDYDPIEKNHFKGWFAFPDILASGYNERRHCLISRIISNGGVCDFALFERNKIVAKQRVSIINAFQDRNNVVVLIDKK